MPSMVGLIVLALVVVAWWYEPDDPEDGCQ